MKFGLTSGHYQFIQENVIEPIQKMGGEVWCFGSRARGDHSPYSDLDLMIHCDHELKLGAIQEILEKSNLPFKVDLVQWNQYAEAFKPGYQKDRKPFL